MAEPLTVHGLAEAFQEIPAGRGPGSLALTVAPAARAALTPFRKRALGIMFDAAVAADGLKLTYANVDVGIAGDPALDLDLIVEGSWEDAAEVRESILAALAAHAASWSESECADFGRMLHFNVSPSIV